VEVWSPQSPPPLVLFLVMRLMVGQAGFLHSVKCGHHMGRYMGQYE
jgi:hypothetical protein